MRTPVIPMTPPVLAIARIASSDLVRGCCGFRARAFACVMSTGFFDTPHASIDVCSPQCETSTAIPIWFMRPTIVTPKSLSPLLVRSVEPSPM